MSISNSRANIRTIWASRLAMEASLLGLPGLRARNFKGSFKDDLSQRLQVEKLDAVKSSVLTIQTILQVDFSDGISVGTGPA